jgi:hypothetical protein
LVQSIAETKGTRGLVARMTEPQDLVAAKLVGMSVKTAHIRAKQALSTASGEKGM